MDAASDKVRELNAKSQKLTEAFNCKVPESALSSSGNAPLGDSHETSCAHSIAFQFDHHDSYLWQRFV